MRIAIVNWSNRRVGGVETYLNTIIPELSRAGNEIAFWSEVDEPTERAQIDLPPNSPFWCVSTIGAERALHCLRDWQPDVIYVHKVADADLEYEVLGLGPSVFFAHDYNGTCISGTKTFKFPIVQPCSRRFGWPCLLHYFPHRCGGLSPVTMLKLFNLQAKRLKNLRRYDAIVTHSDHMLAELINHGLSPQRAYNFPYYVQSAHSDEISPDSAPPNESRSSARFAYSNASIGARPEGTKRQLHLLFSGRMEYLKGGHILLEALPKVVATLQRPIRLTFAGDGRERKGLERQAAGIRSEHIEINFEGWVDRCRIEGLLRDCDLLVVPSLWPEPFGLVGPEAGLMGVPVAAFNVGGIPDWLVDGVNGHLASGSPPSASGLAEAITNCLREPTVHARLSRGAFEVAQQFNIKNHLSALSDVFGSVIASH